MGNNIATIEDFIDTVLIRRHCEDIYEFIRLRIDSINGAKEMLNMPITQTCTTFLDELEGIIRGCEAKEKDFINLLESKPAGGVN